MVQNNVGQIVIDGPIGFDWWDGSGTTSSGFMNAIKELGEVNEIVIDMNSPGGAVSDGLTIANYLRNHDAKVVVNVLGQASSIASVITAAADEVRMGLGAYMFIHNPFTVAVGNADQLRALATDLDTIAAGIVDTYVARVGEDRRAEIEELIAGTDGDGTLLSAEMAMELGLADSMLEVKAAASMTGLSDALNHAKTEAQNLISHQNGSELLTPMDAFTIAFDCDAEYVEENLNDLATQIMAWREAESAEVTVESLTASYPDVVQAIGESAVNALGPRPNAEEVVATERSRVLAIVDTCNATNQQKLIHKLVENGTQETQAIEYITDIAAAADPGIHNSHSPEGGQPPALDTSSIYARRKSKALKREIPS
jgi:ATP-dependent protease ClpP protease subunit